MSLGGVCASRGRSFDRRPARAARRWSSVASTSTARRAPGLIRQREPAAAPAARLPRLLPRLPAARLALGDAPARHRLPVGITDATEIIFLSWLVNCLVPAKLGDIYRAYLLKINSDGVAVSRTFGTVFIERILDLFAIAILGLAAGFWSFRDGLPPEIQVVVALGVVVVVVLAIGLLTLRNFGRRILVRLPLPSASSSCTTGSRKACSARSACAHCRARRS